MQIFFLLVLLDPLNFKVIVEIKYKCFTMKNEDAVHWIDISSLTIQSNKLCDECFFGSNSLHIEKLLEQMMSRVGWVFHVHKTKHIRIFCLPWSTMCYCIFHRKRFCSGVTKISMTRTKDVYWLCYAHKCLLLNSAFCCTSTVFH